MTQEDFEKIKVVLTKHYKTTADDECGAYLNGKWLSIADVLKVIKNELVY